MKCSKKTNIIENIIKIFEKLEKSQFEKEVLDSLDYELEVLSEYLECTKVQSALFCTVFGLQNKTGNAVSFSNIVDYFDENGLYLLKYVRDMNVLIEKNCLDTKSESQGNSKYLVNKYVFDKIIENKPLSDNCEGVTSVEIISEFYNLIIRFKNKQTSAVDFENTFKSYEKRYAGNEIVKKIISEYPDDLSTRIILYSLCFRVMNQDDYQNDDDEPGFSLKIIPCRFHRAVKNAIEEKSHQLFEKNFVTFKYEFRKSFGSRRGNFCKHLLMTQEGINHFFGSESGSYEAEYFNSTEFSRLKEFFLEFADRFESRSSSVSKRFMLRNVESRNEDLKFVKKIKEMVMESDDRFILYDCCNDFVNLNCAASLTKTLQDIYNDEEGRNYSEKVHLYKDEKCFLIKEGFLFLNRNENINEVTIEPADRMIELIYGKDADLYLKKISNQDILNPEELKEKTLFYSDEVLSQLNMLQKSLENENLLKMQARLENKGLPKGIAVLLYGEPGTGKTESVYQLAKATNRKIYHVDISQTKSMWFGESEKLIKKIFVNYKNLCASCERHNENIPILLFNEADAIISKRKSVDAGNTAQTENAIQNIILEQLENLDGIMIATTNLCKNMDGAFERRFLFKVKFNKPEVSERSKIWKNKLNWLSQEEAEKIAGTYDFSGGEIDNIVRKCEIDEIITGDVPDLSKIEELCKVEKFENETSRVIGFGVQL